MIKQAGIRRIASREKLSYVCVMLLLTALIWALWLPIAASDNIRMDSERMIFHPQEALDQYRSEGRIGLVLLMQLFGLTKWNPLCSGVLFLVFFTLSGWLLCHTLCLLFPGRKGREAAVFFWLLYGTSQIWAFHAYFVLQIAPIGFGLMVLSLMGYVDMRLELGNRPPLPVQAVYEVLCALCLGFLLSVYQALGVFFVTVVVGWTLCLVSQGRACPWRRIGLWVARIVLALAMYFLLVRQNGGLNSYLTGQIAWGRESPLTCLFNIVMEAGMNALAYKTAHFSFYPLGVLLLAVLLIQRKERSVWVYLVSAALLLLPLTMSVFRGDRIVPRTQFALQVVAALLPAVFLVQRVDHHRLVRMLCVLVALVQATLVLSLYITDEERNAQDTEAGHLLVQQTAEMDVANKPLIILGTRHYQKESFLAHRWDMYGLSYFDWIYDEKIPGSSTLAVVRLLRAMDDRPYSSTYTPAQLEEALQLSQDMPCWPQDGSVQETQSSIVVKLSQ